LEIEGGVISGLLSKPESGVWSAGGDHAMKTDTTSPASVATEPELFCSDDWFDPLEAGVRTRIRGFIEGMLESELDAVLSRQR
jgi:hypothetical protein